MRDAVSAPVIRIWCVILRRLLDNYDVSQLKKNPYKTDKSFQEFEVRGPAIPRVDQLLVYPTRQSGSTSTTRTASPYFAA
jgi:hypothetical protein